MAADSASQLSIERTRSALLWKHVLTSPFWAIYTLLPFFMYKDLHATSLQILLVIALKPVVSLFSLYWGAFIHGRRDRLLSSLIWGGILGHLPFFFIPWIDNPWFFVFASALYMLNSRGVMPAWGEILKINLPEDSRKKVFAYSSAFYYCCSGFFPFLFGWLMDDYFQAWRWILPATAFLSLSSILFQIRIPIKLEPTDQIQEANTNSICKQLLLPWQKVWSLVRSREDFYHYQIGFMLAGGGIMIVQPALPNFFMDVLHLSYLELGMVLSLCKGFGFAAASPVWAHYMNRINIFLFVRAATGLTCVYFLCLLAAQAHLMWVYIAYIIYGIMQAGSELAWNLSGPVFAKNEDSSLYSSVNVMTVGIRGCAAPPIGSLMGAAAGSGSVMALGLLLSLAATYYLTKCASSYQDSGIIPEK